jgi:hypothetical protein
MNAAVAHHRSWPVYAVPAAVVVALIGMVTAGVEHAWIGASALLDAMIAASLGASLVGVVGGLILANTRRNVMWILPVALATTALLALIAMILAALATG